jgi:trans-aconitate methyltransferase
VIASGSFPVFDRVVEHIGSIVEPASALDLGAGSGKYGRMLRQVAPGCTNVAVEIAVDEPADGAALRPAYDRLEIADIADWWRRNPDEVFDLVIAGDCLQQLPKSAGIDLLNALVYRCAWLIVVVPEFVVQGTVDGASTAVHRSVWSERDLLWHDLWAWDNTRAVSMFLLRGYQASKLNIDQLVARVNEAQLPLLDFDGQTSVRPCRLRLTDHPRETAYRPR